MKIMLRILIVFLLFGIASCRSVKVTEKTSLQTEITENKAIKESSSLQENKASNKAETDRSVITDSTSITKTEIELSKPDSAGKQFPTKITITGQTHQHKKQTDVNTETYTNLSKALTNDKMDNTVSDQKAKTATTTEKKTRPPAWVFVTAVLLALGLIALVYMVLKRFKIIK